VQSKLESSLRRLPPWRLRLMIILERFQYRHANYAVVTSGHNASYIKDSYGIPEEKIQVITNYVDEVLFSPTPDLIIENRLERVLYVGRLSPEKNLDALIRAVAMAKLPIDLVGSGTEEGRLNRLSSDLGVDVRMLGNVSNSDLPAFINSYKYFVLPSYFEGMPKTLLEAMACGVICIGTDVDGINEVIHDGIDGFLAEDISAEAICTAINRAREADLVAVGAAARRNILSRYTLSAVVHREFKLFLEFTK
jgi:glycosyltransferase involved in cell wall biosynthesis